MRTVLVALGLLAALLFAPAAHAGTITDLTASIDSPSAATSARTTYAIGFATSSTGALTAGQTIEVDLPSPAAVGIGTMVGGSVSVGGTQVGSCPTRAATAVTCVVDNGRSIAASTAVLAQAAGSQITVPNGTDIDTATGGSVSVGSARVGSCPGRDGLLVTCVLDTGQTIAPSTAVTVTVDGLTNPPAGTVSAAVATTSDQSRASSSITIGPATNVQNVQLLNTGSSGAGARTSYATTFDLPAGSDLSAAASSQIKVSFPNGNDLTHTVAGTVEDTTAGTTAGSCPTRDDPTKLVTCVLDTGASIPGGHSVRVTIDGVTNLDDPGNVSVAVSTTSDPAFVGSTNVIPVTARTGVAGLTVTNADPTQAASARTTYVAQFAVSATGAMSADANSLIVVGIGGALIATPVGGTVRDTTAGRDVGSCPTHSTTTVTCVLNTGATIASGHAVTLTLNVVGNPDTPGTYDMTVATTSDPAGGDASFDVVSAHPVAQLTGAPADDTPGTATTYAIDFHTSSTGGMTASAQSQVRITFPTGTVFANQAGGTVVDGANGQAIGSCPAHGGRVLLCSLDNAVAIAANHEVKVTATGLTNPPAVGTYPLEVATTSDTSASLPVGIGQAAHLPETTIQTDGNGGFTFTSPNPGSTFQCSLDGGAFTDCTSPYMPPADLPAGDHTLRVRAIDVAGNIDPTPAAQTFTVASTPAATPTPAPSATPAPTATPSPIPAPAPGRTVVATPVSGTVLVQLPGHHGFVAVRAAEGIPLGSTVDTRHGVVQITAPGGGVAKFYDGLFRVTQSGGVTILTLTERLAPCGKGAKAAAKKPRTRRLWGDGHGSFSTRGQYSAATVRGTVWLVQDSCAGTLTKVTVGVVSVRDDVRHTTVLLKAGKHYLAKPRRH